MDVANSWLPEGLSLIAAAIVIAASFFTAALTAAFGLGGGLLLLALMGVLFPPAAIVPVHGIAQLGANLSRFSMQRRSAVWPIVAWFAAGCVLGTMIGAQLYVAAPEQLLRAAVGIFVLLAAWGPKPKGLAPGAIAFFVIGAAGSVLSMFFGATGPIAAAMLSVARLDKLKTAATHAACMVAQHALKSIAFGLVGFAFADWAVLIALIIGAGFGGSYAGTVFLQNMPEERFRTGFRFLLTFFGCYLVGAALAAF